MSGKNESAWERAVKCAITASINYENPIPSISFCDSDVLETCATEFISCRKNCSGIEARKIYSDWLEKALLREKKNDKYLVLAEIGACIGVLAGIVIVSAFIATRFNWTFLLFTVLTVSFLRSCNSYICTIKHERKAASVWKNLACNGSAGDMKNAFEQMEQVLTRRRKA